VAATVKSRKKGQYNGWWTRKEQGSNFRGGTRNRERMVVGGIGKSSRKDVGGARTGVSLLGEQEETGVPMVVWQGSK
jgi:hypothetical protein